MITESKKQRSNYQSLALAVGIWIGIGLADQLSLKALGLAPLLLFLRGKTFRGNAVAPVLLATLTGALTFVIHLHAVDSNPIREFVDERVAIEGVVSSDPSTTRPRVIGSRLTAERITFLMRAESVSSGSLRYQIRVPIRVILDSAPLLIPGQRIELKGDLVATKERKVAALLIAQVDSLRSIKTPWALMGLEKIRAALRQVVVDIGGNSATLIPGMVIGDTSQQSKDLTKSMLDAGLSHLTAVSGANFAIVSAFIFAIIGLVTSNRRAQVIVTIIVLAIFVLLVRPSPSVLRAGVMAAVFLVAKLSGNRNAGVNSLATAIALLLLLNPFQAFEAGFILSVLATSGLLFLAPKIAAQIPGPRALGDLISIPTAATLFCAPYLMMISGGMNLGTVLLNILVAPVVPFITIFGFIATLFVVPAREIARPLLEIADIGASWIIYVASWSESIPSLVTSPITIFLICLLVLFHKVIGKKLALVVLVFLLAWGASQRLIFPSKDWNLGQCDVGQGDALLVNLGKGAAILFDAGPDPRLLDRCLDLFRIDRLPLVVISHAHADHYQGISGVGDREVGEIWSNRELNLLDGVEQRVVRRGEAFRIGSVEIEIVWPETGTEIFDPIDGDGSAENNRSIVAVVKVEDLKILVTGDIEPGAQQEISGELEGIKVIKVPHHGSRFQEPSLFEGVSIFLISVGRNSYGHPDEGLISRLAGIGKVYRSDLDGAISLKWRFSGSPEPIFSARQLGKEWWRISWH